MSVKVEVIEGGIPHQNIMIAGLVSTLVCLYLTYLNVLTNTQMFSFFGGLAVVTALIWGSHTIKVLCSYGIGTGVPSAGMIAFGSGVIAMLLATKFGAAAPIAALVIAAVIGFILGYISNNILNMKIPAMVQALTEMAVVGALTLMGFAALITGGFTFATLTTGTVSLFGMSVSSKPDLVYWWWTYRSCIPSWSDCNPAPVQRDPWTGLETGPDAHVDRRMWIFEHDCRCNHVLCTHQHGICNHIADSWDSRVGIHLQPVYLPVKARRRCMA